MVIWTSVVEDNDAAIIWQSRLEPECFAAIFDRYYIQIHGYAARRLGHSLADDVAAETFLIAVSDPRSMRRARFPGVLARMWLVTPWLDRWLRRQGRQPGGRVKRPTGGPDSRRR
jgi:DNA-directed RNA polymerase specialized sigma24 family protein